MKNLVVKTALITLIVVLSVVIITLAVLTAFAPRVMCKVTSGLGMDNTALWFSVRQYEKTEDISDLGEVVYLASEVEDYDRLTEYGKKLIYNDDFFAYAEGQPNGYVEYVMTSYVYALVVNEDANAWVETLKLYEDFYTSYTANNPIYQFIRFTDSYDGLVLQKLNSLKEFEIDNNLLMQDIGIVNSR